jgi:hypothetical protein
MSSRSHLLCHPVHTPMSSRSHLTNSFIYLVIIVSSITKKCENAEKQRTFPQFCGKVKTPGVTPAPAQARPPTHPIRPALKGGFCRRRPCLRRYRAHGPALIPGSRRIGHDEFYRNDQGCQGTKKNRLAIFSLQEKIFFLATRPLTTPLFCGNRLQHARKRLKIPLVRKGLSKTKYQDSF